MPFIGLLGDGGMGMVAGPEAELVLQRGGVLRRGLFFQLVSSYLMCIQRKTSDVNLDTIDRVIDV